MPGTQLYFVIGIPVFGERDRVVNSNRLDQFTADQHGRQHERVVRQH